ncbi:hypothetical protein HELRODRAFT_181748 [Helobdella robusta]|uniref:NADH dehydrogenase [ubiquinone] 1 alpha subcomplex subunit 5 n=1 Tax=Helobdella robusta TaxID=6412 RepID=T1FHA1_HELRO|nr:hypothetical protein HELRODRAFT_181748 [Helobdella robusta]ESN92129.1 hypothetical protein HELRODRAFT_181748 [Helobdella robusta]
MAGLLKKTTGLTGLAVAKDPHKSLVILYDKLLAVLQKMPASAGYRQKTQIIIQDRLAAVHSEPNIAKLEAKINGGMAEELIVQAEKELTLARKMLEWKPWEGPVKEPPHNQWKWPI